MVQLRIGKKLVIKVWEETSAGAWMIQEYCGVVQLGWRLVKGKLVGHRIIRISPEQYITIETEGQYGKE